MNDEGNCEDCYVAGCLKCKIGNPNICIDCKEGLNITDGICACLEESYRLNYEAECELCNV